jgi:hypothetical protein
MEQRWEYGSVRRDKSVRLRPRDHQLLDRCVVRSIRARWSDLLHLQSREFYPNGDKCFLRGLVSLGFS